MNKKAVRKNLFGLFFIIFLDLLGVGIIIPIMAPLLYDPSSGLIPAGWTTKDINLMYGMLVGIYPIMQFFGAPILGTLSDRYGRKKLLTTSLFGTMIGYLITGWGILTGQLSLVFAGRALDGFTGGNIAVANSAIADMSSEEDRASNFGLVGAAFGLGFIFGPSLGGLLSNPDLHPWFSSHFPFWITAGLTALNLFIIAAIFKETLKESIFEKLNIFTGFKNLYKATQMSEMHVIFFVIFLHQMGFSFFTQFFPVFLVQKFAFNETQIGLLFGFQGIWIAFSQGLFTRIVAKFAGPIKAIKRGLLFLSISLFSLILPTNPWLFLILKPLLALAEGVVFPNTTAIASNLTPDNKQGEVMGIISSIRAAGMAIPPLAAAVLVSINQNLSLLTASLIIFVAWIIFMIGFKDHKE